MISAPLLRGCLFKLRTSGFDDIGKMTAKKFSEILNQSGIPCKPEHLDYVKEFEPHTVPRTADVMAAMKLLLKHFPKLDGEAILSKRTLNSVFMESLVRRDQFTDRITSPK